MRLRVLSFNVRGSFLCDGENAWERRAALSVETVRALDPDVIGFQELQTGNLVTFERELPGYDLSLGPRYNDRPPHFFPSLFWRAARLDAVALGGCWLSRTPDRHSGDWETACIRSAAWATLRCRTSGRTFLHFNTHLDHVSERARVEQARVAIRRLEGLCAGGLPAIVTGDFNSPPDSQTHRLFAAAGFADAYLVAGGRDGQDVFSFHAFRGVRHPRHGRIDWILTRDGLATWNARMCRIVTDARPPLYPSDHYPVVAELELDDRP